MSLTIFSKHLPYLSLLTEDLWFTHKNQNCQKRLPFFFKHLQTYLKPAHHLFKNSFNRVEVLLHHYTRLLLKPIENEQSNIPQYNHGTNASYTEYSFECI